MEGKCNLLHAAPLFNINWLKICYTMGKNKKHGSHDFKARNMKEEKLNNPAAEEATENPVEAVDNFDAIEDGEEASATLDVQTEDDPQAEIEELKTQLAKEKKEYMFLMAEFDNFRKRTLKEKSELIKNAAEGVFKGLLPIVDDMERGIKASETATDVATVREGQELVYNKLIKFMAQNGVKAYDEGDDTFDADRHEAITAVPVQDEAQKGKILDTIEKGYTINDKVLRHARVVVGQ